MRKKHQSWITAYIESIEPKELNLELIDEKTDEDRLRYKERHKQYKNQQL